jgi:hypothetical protein
MLGWLVPAALVGGRRLPDVVNQIDGADVRRLAWFEQGDAIRQADRLANHSDWR